MGLASFSLVAYRKPQIGLGASGATAAMMVYYTFMYPQAQMLLFGIIPMPAPLLLGLFTAMSVYSLASSADVGTISHAGHLGGLVAGVAASAVLAAKGRGGRPQRFRKYWRGRRVR